MEQMKATNALAPFLALTKTANSHRAAANLIESATSAPNTFIFAELLQAPNIQALASSEHSAFLSLLRIFSYGTYSDYQATADLPALNAKQTQKLRQLSFLTLAKNQADLSYKNLLLRLGLETPRELEDLVISAIYAGLISATLDPYHQNVAVSSVSPLRDLQPDSVPAMLNTLNEWSARCVSTLADLEKQITSIKAEALKRHKEEVEWKSQVEKLTETKLEAKEKLEKAEEKNSIFGGVGKKLGGALMKRSNGGLGGNRADDMDVDEENEDGEKRETRSSKKRGIMGLGGGK
ncbi:PCI domain-containing protein [Diplocarpon rosae]|nr:PCI domain-containing protein [Diplocarpon rosae]